MIDNKFPEGWDEAKVRRVLTHYETQSEDDAMAEDEAGVEADLQAGTFSRKVRSNRK
jgi:hypothetical protein